MTEYFPEDMSQTLKREKNTNCLNYISQEWKNLYATKLPLKKNSNGRYGKKNKFKRLSFNNYLIFRKKNSNKIFND